MVRSGVTFTIGCGIHKYIQFIHVCDAYHFIDQTVAVLVCTRVFIESSNAFSSLSSACVRSLSLSFVHIHILIWYFLSELFIKTSKQKLSPAHDGRLVKSVLMRGSNRLFLRFFFLHDEKKSMESTLDGHKYSMNWPNRIFMRERETEKSNRTARIELNYSHFNATVTATNDPCICVWCMMHERTNWMSIFIIHISNCKNIGMENNLWNMNATKFMEIVV